MIKKNKGIYTKIPHLRRFVLQNFPFIEEDFDALTDYEFLCKVVEYLNTVITSQNALIGKVEELEALFNQLHDYVEHYFDNLDVQEEINNKLDQMVEDGTIQDIITSYIQSNVTWTFDTVADMQSSTNLINGSYARTLGYYSANDGGGALYKITDSQPSFIYVEVGQLYAELVLENNTILTKQTGAIGDGLTDDTSQIKSLFDYITANQLGNLTIVVNGFHFVKPNQLSINGTDANNRLTNITLIGSKESSRSYLNVETIKDGFIFDVDGFTDIEDFNNTVGISFNYTRSIIVKYLKFTTNEDFVRGQLPLNGIELLKFNFSQYCAVECNNFIKAFTGLYILNGGGAYIARNNLSLCNIGLRLSSSGDNMVEDNYINSIGYNIYNSSGVLDSRYNNLWENSLVFAQGIYIGGSGNHTIKGGKIEWCAIGIWQDYATNMIYTGIHFDRCNVCGIAITGHNRLLSRATITDNNFVGCGGTTISSSNIDKHISTIGRSCIGANQAVGIMISNNKFFGDNGRLLGAFNNNDLYYGPVYAVYFIDVTESQISNNIINIDSTYAFSFTDSDVLVDGNTTNKVWYGGNNFTVYRQLGNRRAFYNNNPTNYTFGNFDVGDMVYSLDNVTNAYKVSVSGTVTTINTTANVVTTSSDFYSGDGSVIDLGTTYVKGIRTGAYIDIAGVTGVKKIVGVLFNNNHYYAKLNSACDVAVLNASVTNHTPTFVSV